MTADTPIFTCYQSGELIVIGFGGIDALDFMNLTHCQLELVELIKKHQAKALAIDLTGISLVPSGLLGVIASMKKLVGKVMVFNPSAEIRDVFEITRLDKVVELHNVAVTKK